MRRLAPLLFLLPAIQVSARDDLLCESVVSYRTLNTPNLMHILPPVTSSVTYCSEPDALLIQQFDVVYFQANSSIWFNISAASVVSPVIMSFAAFNPTAFLSIGTQR